MAIEISQVNGAGSAILVLDTTNNKRLYFQPDSIVEVGSTNGIPKGNVLIRDNFKCIFVKAVDVTVPSTFATPELLATFLLTNYFIASAGGGGGGSIVGYNLETTQVAVDTKLASANAILANSYGSLLM